MIEIELIDDGKERYTLQSNTSVIGRRYDNNAEAIRVIKPSIEADSVCEMYISNNDNVIDIIEVKDKPIKIRDVVTQYPMVKIGFSFSRATDGYVKNSEAKCFYLLDAIQPVGFVPVDPEIKQKLQCIMLSFAPPDINKRILNNFVEFLFNFRVDRNKSNRLDCV